MGDTYTNTSNMSPLSITLLLVSSISSSLLGQGQHFFGPPAVGLGVGLVGHNKKLQVATSIASRRSSRSYSHQSFIKATPHGVVGYRTATYTSTDHYHYHSTPWSYRWGRSADLEAKERRDAKLSQIGDMTSLPPSVISNLAANVSIAYNPQVWANDMVYKDQDDCSKRLLCELNAKLVEGKGLSENERIIANSFGENNEIDIGAETLAFDLAAVMGREGGMRRCELSYRRCETPVSKMINMINVEVEEMEDINNELEQGVVNIGDIENRLAEEDEEISEIDLEDLKKDAPAPPTKITYGLLNN